jgi:hypothetical protein
MFYAKKETIKQQQNTTTTKTTTTIIIIFINQNLINLSTDLFIIPITFYQ